MKKRLKVLLSVILIITMITVTASAAADNDTVKDYIDDVFVKDAQKDYSNCFFSSKTR